MRFNSLKRKNRTSTILVLLFSLILFSVGYSSWVIADGYSISAGFSLNSGTIEEINKFINLEGESNLTNFRADGFVDNKGTLTFPFQFNTDKKPISAYLGNENIKIKIQIKNTNSQLPSFFNLFSIEAATLRYSNSTSFIENDNYQNDFSLTSSQKVSNKEWELLFENQNFLLFDKTFASFLTSMELKFIGNSFTNDVLNMLENAQQIKFSVGIGFIK